MHNDHFALADSVIKKSIDELNNEQKLSFLIYVVYRYRNNMFHGNKKLDSWLFYKNQINYCIQIMISLIDNHIKGEGNTRH